MALAEMMAMPSLAAAQLTSVSPVCSSGNTVATMGYTDCRGAFSGNDKNQQAGVLTQLASFGGTWTLLGASDDANNGPFMANAPVITKTLTFDARRTGPSALIIKASNSFSIYYFANTGAGVTSVIYTTAGTAVNQNGKAQGLYHATLYAGTGAGGSLNVLPEPSAYLLIATGMIGLVVVAPAVAPEPGDLSYGRRRPAPGYVGGPSLQSVPCSLECHYQHRREHALERRAAGSLEHIDGSAPQSESRTDALLRPWISSHHDTALDAET